MIYNTPITVWKPQEEGRRVSWKRYVLSPVRLEATEGATAAADGDQSARTATLYMPHPIGARVSRKDKVMPGVCSSPVPPQKALTVQTGATLRIGRNAHHYEFTLA